MRAGLCGWGGVWLLTVFVGGGISFADEPRAEDGAKKEPATQPAGTEEAETLPPLAVDRVEVTEAWFNPTIRKDCALRFRLNRPAKLTVAVYGPNQEEIIRLAENREFGAGANEVVWNGRDRTGRVVPDEAYFFTLQAVAGDQGIVIDPLLTSGGERIVAADLNSFEDGTRLSYKLPRACRVLVRAAVVDGPLLRTIVNWEPRTAGLSLEHWDGRDADGNRHILDIPQAKIAVMAFALPDLSVITTGNRTTEYRSYYLKHASQWPRKPPVVRAPVLEGVLSPYAAFPPHLNRDPLLELTLVGLEDPTTPAPTSQPASGDPATQPGSAELPRCPVVNSSPVLVRVDIPDPHERAFMNEQKFELIIYVDDRRVLEVEQGHVPFTYPWDVSKLAGRHVLTVNLASFRNHVGTASQSIEFKP